MSLACRLRLNTGASFSPHVLKTTDGGIAWSEISIPGIDVSSLQGIGFANPLLGWVSGFSNESNQMTTDGGVTWAPVTIGEADPNVNRFAMFGETLGYASGRTIYKYLPDVLGVVAEQSAPPSHLVSPAARIHSRI